MEGGGEVVGIASRPPIRIRTQCGAGVSPAWGRSIPGSWHDPPARGTRAPHFARARSSISSWMMRRGSTPPLRFLGGEGKPMPLSRPGGRSVGTTRSVGRSVDMRWRLSTDVPAPRCHGRGPWRPGRLALNHRMEPDPKNPCHPRNLRPKNCDVSAPLRLGASALDLRWCDVFALSSCLCVFVLATVR